MFRTAGDGGEGESETPTGTSEPGKLGQKQAGCHRYAGWLSAARVGACSSVG